MAQRIVPRATHSFISSQACSRSMSTHQVRAVKMSPWTRSDNFEPWVVPSQRSLERPAQPWRRSGVSSVNSIRLTRRDDATSRKQLPPESTPGRNRGRGRSDAGQPRPGRAERPSSASSNGSRDAARRQGQVRDPLIATSTALSADSRGPGDGNECPPGRRHGSGEILHGCELVPCG